MKRFFLSFCFGILFFYNALSVSAYDIDEILVRGLDKTVEFFLKRKDTKKVFLERKICYQFKFYKIKDFLRFLNKSGKKTQFIGLYKFINEYFYVDNIYKKDVGLIFDVLLRIDYRDFFLSKSPDFVLCNDAEKLLLEIEKTQTKVAVPQERFNYLILKPLNPIQVDSQTIVLSFFVKKIPAYKIKSGKVFVDYGVTELYTYEFLSFWVFELKIKKGNIEIEKKWHFQDEHCY